MTAVPSPMQTNYMPQPAMPSADIADPAKQFLDALFGAKLDEEYVLVWLAEGKRSAWFQDLGKAAEYIHKHAHQDTYVGVALSPADHGPYLRLKIENDERMPSSIVSLWSDIDLLNPGHKKTNLPLTVEDAKSILFPEMPPSITLHSGGGLQCWWLFKEPWVLDSKEETQKAGALAMRWIRALRARAAVRGWDIDSVGDLTRVLRVPGTTNCKIHSNPRPVSIIDINDARYNPKDLEWHLDTIGAEKVDPIATQIVSGSKLVYDPMAQPPHAKFESLRDAEPKFKNLWDHKRRDLVDQSASEYDWALANIVVKAGWKDQEICDLLIAHRRKHNEDLKLRDTYYEKTIRKVRAKSTEQTERRPAEVSNTTPMLSSNMAPWPKPIAEDGFIGIPGKFVKLVEPHTEADRNILLVHFLVYAGNVLGRNCYVMAGGDEHYTNLFECAVGPTSSGRKGSATGPVVKFFTEGDHAATLGNTLPSLSTGEGLIWAIRDEVRKTVINKKTKMQEEIVETEGVSDKRLIINMGEFVSALQMARRQGNTLSPVIRSAWDTSCLVSPTKNSPAKSTGAHVSIIGNISKEELLRAIEENDADNGLLNRFLWCCSRRSKSLPEGGRLWEVVKSEEWHELQRNFNRISPTTPRRLARDEEAADLWGRDDHPGIGVYEKLSRDRYGLAGAATARAHAQVLRLSLLYAVLDGAEEIKRHHLDAALAVWDYCEASARYIFGDALGDPIADVILKALRAHPAGLTRKDLRDLFNRNKREEEIVAGCCLLHKKGLARFERQDTGGRPAEHWFATNARGEA